METFSSISDAISPASVMSLIQSDPRSKDIKDSPAVSFNLLEERNLDMAVTFVSNPLYKLGDVFGFMQVEDPKGRKERITELLKEADDDELKVILKVVMAIVR